MEDKWLTWAKQLQGIGLTGLHYAKDQYDEERYETVTRIANEMLATLGSVPVARIEGLVSEFAKGYATPRVEVRGALILDGKVLLVREASDGLWTLPGGFADVGVSPSENVVKEIWEEATVRVRATALYGVRHKARHSYRADARDFYKLFFLCEPLDPTVAPRPGPEAMDAGFFAPEDLPPLSTGRVLASDIAAAFSWTEGTCRTTWCD